MTVFSRSWGLVLVGLAGCSVGPDFSRPAAPVTDRYTEDATPIQAASGDRQTMVVGEDIAGDWWTLFHSPTLSALVVQALRDSPTLESSRQTLIQAQETTLAQEGGFLPSISGQFYRNRNEIPGAAAGQPGISQTFSVYDAQLNVSYTFDVWGQNRRTVEADVAREAYQRFLLEGSANMLAANTANAAIAAASLTAQIGAEHALLADQNRLLTMVRNQFELGAATGADVATQQAQVAQTEATLPPLVTQLAQTRDQLAALVGELPSQSHLPDFSLDDVTLPMALPLSLPSNLVGQRPDIRAAEAQLHAASAQLGIAIANRLPQFTFSGLVGSEAARPYQLFSPTTGAWTLFNQALAPIFQGGTLLHQQRAARAALQAQAASYRAAVVTGFQNVADALVALAGDADTLRADGAARDAAARSLDLARTQYQYGSAGYQTVLTAELQVQTATLALVRVRAARLSDTVALFVALGGGWWNRHIAPPPPPPLLKSLMP